MRQQPKLRSSSSSGSQQRLGGGATTTAATGAAITVTSSPPSSRRPAGTGTVTGTGTTASHDDDDDDSNDDVDDDETRSLTVATAAAPPPAPSAAGHVSFSSAAAHDKYNASSSLEIDVEHDYQNDDILDSDDDNDDDDYNNNEEGIGFLYPRRYFLSSSSSSRRPSRSASYTALARSRGPSRAPPFSRRGTFNHFVARLGIPPSIISYLPLAAAAAVVGAVLVIAVLYQPSARSRNDVWAVGHHNHGHSAATDYSCQADNNGTATSANANARSSADELEHFLERIDRLPQKERCVVRPGQRGCPCQGSSQPAMPNEAPWNASWQIAWDRNRQLAQNEAEGSRQPGHRPIDVIMLGDSITESWLGTSLAQPAPKFADNNKVYDALFRDADAPIRGLALGIAGDRCTQLLYRLENGEVPSDLRPKAFWVLIGTNDFLWGSCHADEVVAGNVRVVQLLLQRFPGATVFLQSVLPVSLGRRINDDALPAEQSWDVYPDINRRLECYALSTPRVEFVNVTQLFLASPQKNKKEVNETMLPDGLHPGGIAARVWGGVIVENVQRILRSNRLGRRGRR